MRVHEPAICIRTTDYSETSQVVHFLTRGGGIVHLIAKGSKRPRSKTGGALDVFSDGEVVYSDHGGESLGTLIEFTETASHTPLRKNAEKLYAAMYLAEMIPALLPVADPAPGVFDLLHRTLARLGEPDAPPEAVLAYAQWRLLQDLGLLGDLGVCVHCGQALREGPGLHFSSRLGGIVCGRCAGHAPDRHPVDAATLRGLEVLASARRGERREFPRDQARAVNRLLAYHAQQQIGRPLRTARYAIA